MADKPRTEAERLARIVDGLAEYIENVPAEEIVEASREEGQNPSEVAAHVKDVLKNAVKNYQQRELMKAKAAYEQEIAAMSERRVHLPKRPETRRRWLDAVFQQQPQLQAAFTLQNRDFSELTDEDIEAHLRKLE